MGTASCRGVTGSVVRLPQDKRGGNGLVMNLLRVNNDLFCDLAALVLLDDSVPGRITAKCAHSIFPPFARPPCPFQPPSPHPPNPSSAHTPARLVAARNKRVPNVLVIKCKMVIKSPRHARPPELCTPPLACTAVTASGPQQGGFLLQLLQLSAPAPQIPEVQERAGPGGGAPGCAVRLCQRPLLDGQQCQSRFRCLATAAAAAMSDDNRASCLCRRCYAPM